MTAPKEAGLAAGEDQQSPRVTAIFDRLSARVGPPPVADWESALNGMSDRPADHGQAAPPSPPQFKVHPAAEIFPLLGGEDLEALIDDVAQNGLREPIWLFRDLNGETVLLDGRNRVAACRDLGIEPETRYYEGDDPVGFAVSLNLRRRHLSAGQRASIAADLMPVFARDARERQRAGRAAGGGAGGRGRPTPNSLTADLRSSYGRERNTAAMQSAVAAGTSARAVEQFTRIKKSDPDLARQVADGTVPLDRAEKAVRAATAPPAALGRQALDVARVTTIVCAPPDWPHQLPFLDVNGTRLVVDTITFGRAKAAIEKSLPARAAGNPGAEATSAALPPAVTAEDYRRAKEGG